jgi:hypothetical protein
MRAEAQGTKQPAWAMSTATPTCGGGGVGWGLCGGAGRPEFWATELLGDDSTIVGGGLAAADGRQLGLLEDTQQP